MAAATRTISWAAPSLPYRWSSLRGPVSPAFSSFPAPGLQASPIPLGLLAAFHLNHTSSSLLLPPNSHAPEQAPTLF
ncbi:unnamed protein product [Staurois parvus]|uniref:Uncharacterized protein n=1 Tax=Staurois parvus TaxID=386267 RepID=A0ABN9F430_9NEOB|nr:unnamed protein product [Staurois parvus]